MGPDYRVLVARARKMAHAYKLEKGEDIPTSQLVSKVATVMQEYTQSGGVRPFGVSLLIAGFDKVCTLILSFTLLSTAKALNSCVPFSDSFDWSRLVKRRLMMAPFSGLDSYFASRNTELHGYRPSGVLIEEVPALCR